MLLIATPQYGYTDSELIQDFETNLDSFDSSNVDSTTQEEAAQLEEVTLEDLFLMLQQDPLLVQQLAQQLQIETTNPEVIIETLVNQFNSANQSPTAE